MRELTCIVCPVGCLLLAEESASLDGASADGANANSADANAASAIALKITGNKCPRGGAYAQEEMREPKRTVTATCAVVPADGGAIHGNVGDVSASAAARSLCAPRRVPVKTSAPCPREKIPALLADIYKAKVALPVRLGDVIIADWNGCGIDVVATRSLA